MSLALEEDAGNIIAMETMAVERQEISRMVKCRMSSLGLPLDDYSKYPVVSMDLSSVLYVLNNLVLALS